MTYWIPLTKPGRKWLVLTFAIFVAGVFVTWSSFLLRSSYEEFDAAGKTLDQNHRLTLKLVDARKVLQEVNVLASEGFNAVKAIEIARSSAGLQNSRFQVSIRTGRALGASIVEKIIEVPALESISLEQLIRFLHAIDQGETLIRVKSIALSPSNKNKIPGTAISTWDAICEIVYYEKNETVIDRQRVP